MGNTENHDVQPQVPLQKSNPNPTTGQSTSPNQQRFSYSPKKVQTPAPQLNHAAAQRQEHFNLINSSNNQTPLVGGIPKGQVAYQVQDQIIPGQSPQSIRRENLGPGALLQPAQILNAPPPIFGHQNITPQPQTNIPPPLPHQNIIPNILLPPQPLYNSLPSPQTLSNAHYSQPGPFTYFQLSTQQQFQEGTFYYLMRKENYQSVSQSIIQQRTTLAHPHLIKTFGINNSLINAILNQNDDPTGIYFAYLNTNLRQLILERKASQLFTQGDLVSMVKGLVFALSYLQKNNIFHGDISPETVYFDENLGLFKVADEELINGEFQCFYQARLRKKVGLIPPELIPSIRNINILEVKENFYKADVFSLGLTLLEAATLKQKMIIISQVLYERIYFLSAYYSPELTHALRLMLELDPSIRPDFIQLHNLLSQKVPKNRRKVAWPPIPIGLSLEQKNAKTAIMQQQQPAYLIQMPNQTQEYIQSNEQTPVKLTLQQYPRMLSAMPQKALERIEELNQKLNQLKVFQKPLEIVQHNQVAGQSNNEKVQVTAYQPSGETFNHIFQLYSQQQSQQQQQPQQQQEQKPSIMKKNEEFSLQQLISKVPNDNIESTPIKQENQQIPPVNILQKTPDQQMQSYQFINNQQIIVQAKERHSASPMSNEISDFKSKNVNNMNLAIQEQYQKQEQEKSNRLDASINVVEKQRSYVNNNSSQQNTNFKDTVEKIKAELSETKRLIENYHKKTEQLKKDLNYGK